MKYIIGFVLGWFVVTNYSERIEAFIAQDIQPMLVGTSLYVENPCSSKEYMYGQGD